MKELAANEIDSLLKNYDKAKLDLIDSVQKGLYAIDNKVYDKLDFYDKNLYLDPFFFFCINTQSHNLLAVLIGCYSESGQFKITTDRQGEIYLPKYGFYKLQSNDNEFIVCKIKDCITFYDFKGNNIEFKFSPIKKGRCKIEFFEYSHPAIKGFFEEAKILRGNKNKDYFESAMVIIESIFPEFYSLILKSVKKTVFFTGTSNSFATLKTHGIIFINVREDYNEVSFIDDIIHQSGHVVFNTLTFKDKNCLFKFSHNSNLETTHLYGRFHGLFTMCLISLCLTRCLKAELFDGSKRIELIGRIVDNMKKFKRLLSVHVKPEYCTELGLEWLNKFQSVYRIIYKENRKIIEKYDVSNQPYVFDNNIFLSTNGLNK